MGAESFFERLKPWVVSSSPTSNSRHEGPSQLPTEPAEIDIPSIVTTTRENNPEKPRGHAYSNGLIKIYRKSPEDIRTLAHELMESDVPFMFPFYSVYGMFGAEHNPVVDQAIKDAKERTESLVNVRDPRYLHEVAYHPTIKMRNIRDFYLHDDIRAMGLILPAKDEAPDHLVTVKPDGSRTIAILYAQYEPLQILLDNMRGINMSRPYTDRLKSVGLAATSLNRHGEPTITDAIEAIREFRAESFGILVDDFAGIPAEYRCSTPMLDISEGNEFRVHRIGSVRPEVIDRTLVALGFKPSFIDESRPPKDVRNSVSDK